MKKIKSKMTLNPVLTLTVMLGLGLCGAIAGEKEQARLEGKAKITKAEAHNIALTKVADGSVKDAEIEEEGGKLIWSFDIIRPGTKNITEVQLDAMTGKVVNIDVESPKDQAKEAVEDAAMEKSSGK